MSEDAGRTLSVELDGERSRRNFLKTAAWATASPPANTAFAQALTMDQVLEAVAPFLGMGAMPTTGGPGEG